MYCFKCDQETLHHYFMLGYTGVMVCNKCGEPFRPEPDPREIKLPGGINEMHQELFARIDQAIDKADGSRTILWPFDYRPLCPRCFNDVEEGDNAVYLFDGLIAHLDCSSAAHIPIAKDPETPQAPKPGSDQRKIPRERRLHLKNNYRSKFAPARFNRIYEQGE